jgi:hypothetical protein
LDEPNGWFPKQRNPYLEQSTCGGYFASESLAPARKHSQNSNLGNF